MLLDALTNNCVPQKENDRQHCDKYFLQILKFINW